jgi:hypothetical protein
MTTEIVTANRLNDGLVVYLDGAGGWSERIAEARVAQGGEDAAALLALAEEPEHAVRVVGPYLMEVALDGAVPRPTSNRERIRALGPTVRTDVVAPATQASAA